MKLKKVIILDSSYPINSRNLRINDYLNTNYCTFVITWDRKEMIKDVNDRHKIFKKKAMYGKKLEKLRYFPEYFLFVRKNIRELNPDIVIASNWDMLVIASLVKVNINFKLIYENRDMVSSRSYIIKKTLSVFERIALINTDAMILASRFFLEFYSYYKKDKLVIENKVSKSITGYEKNKSNKLRISFVGTVRFYEILKNLIEACKEFQDIELNIYGEGPDRLKIEQLIKSQKIMNVKVHGEFKYEDIGEIYANTDIVWSVYPNTENSNKKYVIPNKYFESIHFKIPGIFPMHTRVGDLIKDQNTGYIVDPYSRDEIRLLVEFILKNREDVMIKVNNIMKNIEGISFEEEIEKLKIII